VAGVDVVAEPSLAKQAIGMVSQSNNLDRNLTVRENLYYHGRYFGLGSRGSRQAADELLERFRLADRADADVGTLSGNEDWGAPVSTIQSVGETRVPGGCPDQV